MTFGSFCTASMLPSASTEPSCSTVTVRAIEPHELHVVLDHHHRVLAGQRQQQLGGALDFLRRHAGHRLIDQQQSRVLHEQHADLEPLLLAMREDARARIALVLQPDRDQHLIDARNAATVAIGLNSVCQTDLFPAAASARFCRTLCCSKTVGF